jgi:hypothetical protein
MLSMHAKDQAAFATSAGIPHPLHGHQGLKLPDEIKGHRGHIIAGNYMQQ